jgi:hypothetical protein
MRPRSPSGGSDRYGRAPGVGITQRPAQPVGQMAQRSGGQADEQVAVLVAGERDQLGRWWVADTLDESDDDQEGVGEHGQGHPAVPAAPAADLVLVQAAQSLAGLGRLLYPPAGSGNLDQGDQRQAGRAGAYVPGQLPGEGCGGPAATAATRWARRCCPAAGGSRRTSGGPCALAGADAQPARRRDALDQPGCRHRRMDGSVSGSVRLTASTYGSWRASSQPHSPRSAP